jgi:DNA-binding transcriptional regulator WhiA
MRQLKRQTTMKFERTYLTFLIACILTACSNGNEQKTVSSTDISADNLQTKSSIDKQVQKTLKLDYDFEIKIGQKEDFEKFETYTLFILTNKKKQLYLDTSLTEYEFGDKLYPIVRQLDKETFEVLVEVNDRPSKNYLKYFRVHQDKIVSTEKLPTFISRASNLDTDDNLELAGFWDWGETWGDNGSLTAYNPIIYYELKPSGITLDSTLTISKNKEIFGGFHGFKYNEKVEIKTSKTKKWDNEIGRINGTK